MEKKINCDMSLLEFVDANPVRSRRGYKMSFGYLYRLIRQDIDGTLTRPLWFTYELIGNKGKVRITGYEAGGGDA